MPSTKPNVAALVEQMPATDHEKEGKPGDPASKFSGPDPAAAEKIFTEILSGGRESIIELLGLVREAGDADFKNYKAGYVLHGLVIHAGRAGQEEQRRLLAETLASELGSDKHSKAVKGYFIRELRLIGGKEAVGALGKLLLDDELCGDAAQALLTLRDGAAFQFRSALEKSKGKNRLTIIQAFGSLQDIESAAALEKALGDEDRDVRRTSAWSLANTGHPSAVSALLNLADGAEGFERVEAAKACLLLAEKLAASGKKSEAARIYAHLRDTRKEPAERYVGEAAERALSGLR
ncbi:MAG: HEAT repeat domain-containing protein [Verrucomicrobiales bacterium]